MVTTAAEAAETPGAATPLTAAAGAGGRMGTALRVIKVGGRVMLVVGIAASVAEVAMASPEERPRVASGVAGGFVGGLALGATAGLFCGPGAPICSVVLGLGLGAAGAFAGREVGEEMYDSAHPHGVPDNTR